MRFAYCFSFRLAQVLISLLHLSTACRINLGAAVVAKLEKNAKKYPKDRVFGSAKKYNEYKEFHSAAEAAGSGGDSARSAGAEAAATVDDEMSLEDLRERMDQFVKNRGWEQVGYRFVVCMPSVCPVRIVLTVMIYSAVSHYPQRGACICGGGGRIA
jgi:hypothetical protein